MASSNIKLGVNIDHVATLRQARGTQYPSVVQAALRAEEAGADSITITCEKIDVISKTRMFMRFAHCFKRK